jgi:hypothetical protein
MASRVAFSILAVHRERITEPPASSTVALTLGTEGVATALGGNVNAPLAELGCGADRT